MPMSAAGQKALVRRFLEEGMQPGDLAVFDELLAPDVLDHAAPPGIPLNREGWKQNRAIFTVGFPDLTITIEDLLEDGDKVIVRLVFRGTHLGEFFGIPPTGKAVIVTHIHIFRVANGRIVEHWGNADDLGMLRQLGVLPDPAESGI